MTPISWIASYPKSGNTWLRLTLYAAMNPDRELDINAFDFAYMAAVMRSWFDDVTGIPSADLEPREILDLRAAMLRTVAEAHPEPLVAKIHDARVHAPGGAPLVPDEVTRAAVYLVRDPRDVAPSLARHMNVSVDRAIEVMGSPGFTVAVASRAPRRQLPEIWSSWSDHVRSWIDGTAFPTLTVRYEDVRAAPLRMMRQMVDALGLDIDGPALARALERTDLARLRSQEIEHGFIEAQGPHRFFGKGEIGGWRASLTQAQAARIEADHGAMMHRLGYLD